VFLGPFFNQRGRRPGRLSRRVVVVVKGVGGVEAVFSTPLVVVVGRGAWDDPEEGLDGAGDESFGDGGDVRS
jgi:hypothetical protein